MMPGLLNLIKIATVLQVLSLRTKMCLCEKSAVVKGVSWSLPPSRMSGFLEVLESSLSGVGDELLGNAQQRPGTSQDGFLTLKMCTVRPNAY